MLSSPDQTVVGATDVAATIDFLEALGFEAGAALRVEAPAAATLYGLDGATVERHLAVPGTGRGGIRVVGCDLPGGPPEPFALGPTAIDLYTRDLDRSLALAAAAGARCGPVGRYGTGGATMAEARAVGPDGLPIVFIALAERRPSVLDVDAGRLHSEVHSVVWAVPDIPVAAAPWRAAGLETVADLALCDPAIDAFLELGAPGTTLRLVLLADAAVRPSRLELLAYDRPGPTRPSWPLRGGLHAVAWTVADPAGTAAQLGLVGIATAEVDCGTACTGVSPGGVRVELRPERPMAAAGS